MKENLLNYGKAILENMRDLGTDVVIFNRFLCFFRDGNYEMCKDFHTYNLRWLDSQPLKEEIIMFYKLVKQYISIIEK